MARSFIPSSNAGVTFSLSQRRVGAPAPLVSAPIPIVFVSLLVAEATVGVVATGVIGSGVGVETVVGCCWSMMVKWLEWLEGE